MKKSLLLFSFLFASIIYAQSLSVLSSTNATCNGINDGSAQVLASGGTPPYTYNWLPSGGTNDIATNLAPGIYTVTVTDQSLSTATTTVTINENYPIIITLDSMSDYLGYNVACNGDATGWINTSSTLGMPITNDTVTFNFTGAPQTFVVPAGITQITLKAWGAQGGANWVNNVNYGGFAQGDLTVTPGETLYVYVGEQPTSIIGGYNGGGNGEGAGKGGGGASDVRQGGNTLNNRVIVGAGAGAGGYWSGLHVVGGVGGGLTGGNGYRDPDYASNPGGQGATQLSSGTGTCVSFNNPSVSGGFGYGGSPSGCGCEGYGGGGGWYGGAGSGNCRGGGGGSSYLGTLANSITTPGVNIGNGKVQIIYAASTTLSYQWSTGPTTEDITNLTAGVYNYTVTSTAGCISTATYTITEPQVLNTTIVVNNITCNGANDGNITAIPDGGTPGYSYLWNTMATTDFINGLAPSTYTVVITDANGCTLSASALVSEPDPIMVSAGGQSNVNCFGENTGTANVIASGGSGSLSYLWTPAGGTNPTADSLIAGNYTVTVTDTLGCSEDLIFDILQPLTAFTNNMDASMISCFGANDGALSSTPGGGSSPYTYLWLNTSETTSSINGLTPGVYVLVITDSAGCTLTDSMAVTEPSDLLLSATTVSESFGNDGSINLTVSGGTIPYSFNWSNSSINEDLTGLTGGSYTVIVTDSMGCTDSLTVLVGSTIGIVNEYLNPISVYPNPSDGIFFIGLDGSFEGPFLITILDIEGKVMHTVSDVAPLTQSIAVNAGEWSSGVYLIRMHLNESLFTRKIILK